MATGAKHSFWDFDRSKEGRGCPLSCTVFMGRDFGNANIRKVREGTFQSLSEVGRGCEQLRQPAPGRIL